MRIVRHHLPVALILTTLALTSFAGLAHAQQPELFTSREQWSAAMQQRGARGLANINFEGLTAPCTTSTLKPGIATLSGRIEIRNGNATSHLLSVTDSQYYEPYYDWRSGAVLTGFFPSFSANGPSLRGIGVDLGVTEPLGWSDSDQLIRRGSWLVSVRYEDGGQLKDTSYTITMDSRVRQRGFVGFVSTAAANIRGMTLVNATTVIYDNLSYDSPVPDRLTPDSIQEHGTKNWEGREGCFGRLPGSTQDDPMLPTQRVNHVSTFILLPGGRWFDPPIVYGYRYRMTTPGAKFTSILDFPTGFSQKFTVSLPGNKMLGTFGPGEPADFLENGGTTEFTITGIRPRAETDVADAFPVRLAFNVDEASFEMTELTAATDATQPELLKVPAVLEAQAESPTGAMVTWPSPFAVDPEDGLLPVTCSPASGSTFAPGGTVVTCSATDGSGNRAESNISVWVRSAPSVALTAPTASAAVRGVVTIKATATDPIGVSFVDFVVDGMLIARRATPPYEIQWDSRSTSKRSVRITATAYNPIDVSRSYSVDVEVNNSRSDRTRADFNGDGAMDLLWQNIASGYLATWSLNGTSLQSSDLLAPGRVADTNWRMIGTGDFDGDQKPDIVWQEQTQGWIGVWLMNGTTLKLSTTLAPASRERVADTNWKITGVVDLNNDGHVDILWQEQTQGWLAAWLLDRLTVTASIGLSPERVADTNWKVVGNGDFNDDGKSDLVWQNLATGYLAAWLMNGVTLLDSVLLSPHYVTDTNWSIVAAGDVDLDGKDDLVWQDRSQGWLAIWLMNGTTLKQSIGFTPERVSDTTWRIVGPK